MFSTVAIGVALFTSTNIDDIFLLSAFFADRHLAPGAIVTGQFLGIAALAAISAAAALAALSVPEPWIALLGIVPLWMGFQKLWQLHGRPGTKADREELEARELALEKRSRSQIVAVASVTMANGGDNLAVYIPVFATSPGAIPTYLVVFAVMTGVWCAVGYGLVNNPMAGAHIRRYGHIGVPVVLVALGVSILHGAIPLVAAVFGVSN